MENNYYESEIYCPRLESLGYVVATANILDKHDRSAPSDYHWKILKCRMIIFSHSGVLASPDRNDVKKVHIVFPRYGDEYDRLNSLFSKFSLLQDGEIRHVDIHVYLECFRYTVAAKIAPLWNTIGYNYLINNREFLTASGPQDGLKYSMNANSNSDAIVLQLKPIKINLLRSNDIFFPGECVRVLPSLNKATVEEFYENLPKIGDFKSYKDLRRHWKNIHGYRLPEEERSYYSVRFWRGDPLTYPDICLLRLFPTITPILKSAENVVLEKFLCHLKHKMPTILRTPLEIIGRPNMPVNETFLDTQAVSLCTPTQITPRKF
ncbi:uncharacterized protein C18orf63-like [Leptidea sinapis]|uniref:uncharacterized protein C18orf63-like n=1 Tax=Leptidea sinapis TaxID=189913 RepID=UPI00212FD5B6|nr:uncharacterized protein C18orf63-like [Leptidea sinapis]